MEIDPQLSLFEPVYLLKESALRKLREFDIDGAQEDLNRIEISEPKNSFAVSSLIAITDFRKKLYRALEGKSLLQGAEALYGAWLAFQSEAGSRFSVDSTLLAGIGSGVRQQVIEMLEGAPEEEVMALYPRLSLGHLKLEAGDYRGALITLQKLLDFHQEDPKLLTALANASYHLGRYPEAEAYYLRAFFSDVEAAFREGVENKLLTLSFESFLDCSTPPCWFPVYALLNGAIRLSPSTLNSAPWAHPPSEPADPESYAPIEDLEERDKARLFFIYLARAEEAAHEELTELHGKMKELNPVAFRWYLASRS